MARTLVSKLSSAVPFAEERARLRALLRVPIREQVTRCNAEAMDYLVAPFGHTRRQWLVPHGKMIRLDNLARTVSAATAEASAASGRQGNERTHAKPARDSLRDRRLVAKIRAAIQPAGIRIIGRVIARRPFGEHIGSNLGGVQNRSAPSHAAA